VGHVNIHRDGFVWAAEYTSDERGILTAGHSGLVERWDTRTGAQGGVLFEGEGETTVLDVSVADGIAAVAFRREEHGLVVSGGVVFVDPDRGVERSRYTIDGRAYPITVSMDATGRRAIGLWSDGVARVVDAEGDPVLEYEVERRPIRLNDSLAELSADGSRAVVVDGREIAMIDTGSGDLVETLSTDRIDVWTLAMSADGSRVAAGLGDSTVRIWDVRSGEQIASLVGHTAYVTSVAFSPDGAYVVSGALDGTARIWTVGGTEIEQVRPAEAVVTTVGFSDDGRRILVGGLAGSRFRPSLAHDPVSRSLVRVYDCDVCRSFDDLVSLARSRVTRQLTTAERAEYLSGT
jgi:WD40 repeat protein